MHSFVRYAHMKTSTEQICVTKMQFQTRVVLVMNDETFTMKIGVQTTSTESPSNIWYGHNSH